MQPCSGQRKQCSLVTELLEACLAHTNQHDMYLREVSEGVDEGIARCILDIHEEGRYSKVSVRT